MAKIQIIQPDSGPSAGQAGLAKFSKETSSISVLDAYAGQGGKISTGFFLLQTRAPHLSKEKSQLLFFPRGRNRSSPTGRTEQEKELRLNLCSVNTTTPPPLRYRWCGWGRRPRFCHILESRRGNEISCLMVQLLHTQAVMSCYHKHSRKGKRKLVRITLWKLINLLLLFPPRSCQKRSSSSKHLQVKSSHQIKAAGAWQS